MKLSSDSNLIQGFVAAPVRCILDYFENFEPYYGDQKEHSFAVSNFSIVIGSS